jgi:hypothetical protein
MQITPRPVAHRSLICPWFATPNDAFGGLKPLEVIERGERTRLWDMVYRLQAGVAG